jgi:hypothetical protein
MPGSAASCSSLLLKIFLPHSFTKENSPIVVL